MRLALDADGFYKPVVDREKCNECGVCQQKCPVLADRDGKLSEEQWPEPKAFAAWTNDEQLRLASSSGGVFSELAKTVIDAGGAVAGCVWGENWFPKHILARTWAEVESMRGSKYVPSNVGNVFREVNDFLCENDGKQVLFSGTPCQVAAMEAALTSEQRKRTLLVDLICHGVPSLRVFHRYLDELFDGDAVTEYSFRDKAAGEMSIRAESARGQRRRWPASEDAFYRGFTGHHLYVMDACHCCQFARLPRVGDITLGDFWGCPEQWRDRRGVSVALANTPAGLNALERAAASKRIELKPTDPGAALAGNPRALPAGRYRPADNRREFLDGLIRGERFADLKAQYFPTQWQLWRKAFSSSRSKWRFLAADAYRRLRRFVRPKYPTI